ncbi:DUF6215 domain-containing protein [Streptomyces sp. NPDC008139]|uniref:DUF6215 domain-containing protein n=1 Tax=Streptomyces sp. NPDC008139 TaxID=3364814 RepID=UPI0036F14BB4
MRAWGVLLVRVIITGYVHPARVGGSPRVGETAEGSGAAGKGAGAWGQAVTAVVLVGALGVGLWTLQKTAAADSAWAAATCAGGVAEEEAGYVSGARLCGGLNRQDLAELLGTPGEVAKSASGDGGSVRLSDSESGPGVRPACSPSPWTRRTAAAPTR